MKKYTTILGVNVSMTNYHETLKRVSRWIETKKKNYVCVAATHLIMECQENQLLRLGVNRAGLVTPDGMPLVWLLKYSENKKAERVYGPTLMLKLCALAEKNNWKIFLLGGAVGQGILLSQRLKQCFPKLQIADFIETPVKTFTTKENIDINNRINRTKSHIVFVGLGCPYQELWMINNRTRLNTIVLIGVGAAFNFLTGREKQAPKWVQAIGFEWLFRFVQNPQRLWYRYTITNITFLFKLAMSYCNPFKKGAWSSGD